MRRRQMLPGLALFAASCARAGPAGRAVPEAPALPCLDPFFAALRGLANGTRAAPVNVIQIGDSHTANDGFSGRMRELMQARFGNAGRGLLPPGIPFRFYKPDDVHVTAQGWTVVGSIGTGAPGVERAGPFGIAGCSTYADGPAVMTLEVTRPGDLAQIDLEFLAAPQGGIVHVSFDDGPGEIVSTRGAPGLVWRALQAPAARRISLRTDGAGRVNMLSWRMGRRGPGVTWSNLGTIGATVALLARWDPALVRAELQRQAPALILLAFGSNEGFQDSIDLAAYEASYRAAIAQVREAALGAALLLVGPPDGVRRRRPQGGTVCAGGVWEQPPNLDPVRQAQRRVAHALDLPWWDFSRAMGGACSMADWAARTPPLAAADHLHLLHAGYRQTAEALFADLMRGYARSG